MNGVQRDELEIVQGVVQENGSRVSVAGHP
jgi:hypothetical protein